MMKTSTFFVLVAIAGVAYGSPVLFGDDCPDVCPEVHKPVCGSDGVETRTFDNECKMLQHSCLKSHRFNLLRSGDCEHREPLGTHEIIPGFIPGLRQCPEVWNPVCGSDGVETKTFPNDCIMEVLNSLDKKEFRCMRSGPCDVKDLPKQKERKDCPPCILIYNPVCASDGFEIRSFYNDCAMTSYNCFESRNFLKTRSGEC